jgi:hypothetical protein
MKVLGDSEVEGAPVPEVGDVVRRAVKESGGGRTNDGLERGCRE